MHHRGIQIWLAAFFVATLTTLWSGAGFADAGDGLKAGDLTLSPSLTLSGSFNQNVFRVDPEETEPISSPLVSVTPALRVSTLDASAVDFSFDGSLTWDQYLADSQVVRRQSGLQGAGGLGLTLNPEGGVSLTLSDNLVYTNEPPPYPTGITYNRLVNRAGATVGIHPGTRVLQLDLGYEYGVYRYLTPSLVDLAKDRHKFQADFTWQFLPKTAVVLRGTASLNRYREETRSVRGSDETLPNVDSTPIRVVGGLSGNLRRRLSARLLGGYSTALYEFGPTHYGPLARADLTYQYGSLSLDNKLSLGYKYDFNDSTVGNYYTYHRAGLDWQQNFAEKRFGLMAGVHYTRRDYSSITALTDGDGDTAAIEDSQGRAVAVPDNLTDNYINASAGVKTQIFEWWGAALRYRYSQNITGDEVNIPSDDITQLRRFSRHMVTLSTTVRY